MRKIICLLTVLVLCLSIAAPAFAVENNGFVPSITYKPNPEIVPVEDVVGQEAIGVIHDKNGSLIGYIGHGCLMTTPVAHVWDDEVEVPADVERLLTKVYEGLNEGTIEIPYEEYGLVRDGFNMVIRDLFDARWVCTDHPDITEEDGVTFDITFDLGIMPDVEISVMTYDEEANEWSPIVKTVNNGDGTVTCTFEHLCAIAFSTPIAVAPVPVEDAPSCNIWPWIILLIVAIIAVIVVLIIKKKKKAEA
jgi:hypothetical protein